MYVTLPGKVNIFKACFPNFCEKRSIFMDLRITDIIAGKVE